MIRFELVNAFPISSFIGKTMTFFELIIVIVAFLSGFLPAIELYPKWGWLAGLAGVVICIAVILSSAFIHFFVGRFKYKLLLFLSLLILLFLFLGYVLSA